MKKLAHKLSLVLIGFWLTTSSALAQNREAFFSTDPTGPPSAVATDSLGGAITTVINYALGILGLIATAFIIYAGTLFITAGGDDGAIEKAKKIITYAAIGIVVILLSYSIVRFVTGALGG